MKIVFKNKNLKTVCIAGAGVGGTILALELSKSNKYNVILVDVDSLDKNFIDEKIDLPFFNIGQKFNMPSVRSFGFGGTTNIWHGLITKIEDSDIINIDKLANSNLKDELPFYYNRLESYFPGCGLLNKEFNSLHSNNLFHEFFIKSKFKAKNFLLQKKPLRARELLKNATKLYSNLRVIEHSVAIKLLNQGNVASGLLVNKKIDKSHSKNFLITADYFVIASGGLETPRILAQSTMEGFFSIKNKNTGHFLMDHPWTIIGELFSINGKVKFGFTDIFAGKHVRFRLGLLPNYKPHVSLKNFSNHCLILKPKVFENYNEFLKMLKLVIFKKFSLKLFFSIFIKFRLSEIFNFFLFLIYEITGLGIYADKGLIFCYLEQTPNFNSKISLSKIKDKYGRYIPNVNWKISSLDLKEALSLNHKIFYALKNSKNFIYKPYKLKKSNFSSGCHFAGTSKMGKSKNSGVVNKNLRVYGSKNIFICDLSIFPRYGNSNPTFTLAAMSVRLADFLISQESR